MKDVEQRELEEYRREHFAVKVAPQRSSFKEPGEIELSVTHNGHQWQVIALTPIERLAVIKALLLE